MRGTILNELSIENVMKHTRYLADEFPDCYSGNTNERKPAAYREQVLKSASIPATLHEFAGYASLPVDSHLRILTPAFASVSGRYGQDPYGMINLRSRFPGLYYAPQLSKLSSDSDEYHLFLNGSLRDRNRVSDALQEALHGMQMEIEEE